MNKIPDSILTTIEEGQSFLLMAHHKPDGDAVGSTIAFGRGLKAMGKDVDYYLDTPVEEKLDFFSEIQFFNTPLKSHYDVICFLDCSTLEYAHRPDGDITSDEVMVIDHHRSNESFGTVNFVEETAATGELVFRILDNLGVALDPEMIDAIFTSISTDTGSFQFSNVSSDTHIILSRLYELRDNFAPLSKRLHSEKSYNQTKMLGAAIQSLEIMEDGQMALVFLSKEVIEKNGGAINITDDIANVGVNIRGVILAVTVKEKEERVYRVSLRSKTPYPIDVSEFAKRYDGGGHMRAAGFTYEHGLDALKKELVTFFEGHGELE